MTRIAIIATALALALAPTGIGAADDPSEGLLGRVPRQCATGAKVGCPCSESSAGIDCSGAKCVHVPLRVTASGVLTIIVDDRIVAYASGDGPPASGGDSPTTRAFTLLVDIKLAGRQHLLSETYQNLTDAGLPPSGDDRIVDEQALVDRFGPTAPPADPSRPPLYFVPRGALKDRLLQLLGSDATGTRPVFIGLKKQGFDDRSGDLLATAVSLKVALALAPSDKVCGGASPTPASTGTGAVRTTTPTPIGTATLHPTASSTTTASPVTTILPRTATPTAVVTVTPVRTATASSAATATLTPRATATPTTTQVPTVSPSATSTSVGTATASAVASPVAATPTAGPVATPTETSRPNPDVTPTPVPTNVPVVVLEDRSVPLRSRGTDTYVRIVLTNPTTVDLGRIPYTATFAVVPADGQVVVTTPTIEGRPVFNAGYKDYLRIGVTTDPAAPLGEHQVIGIFRFSPSSLPAGSPPIQITATARVRIE